MTMRVSLMLMIAVLTAGLLVAGCGAPDEAPPSEGDLGLEMEDEEAAPAEIMVAVESEELVLIDGEPVDIDEVDEHVREMTRERQVVAALITAEGVSEDVVQAVERRLEDGGVAEVRMMGQ